MKIYETKWDFSAYVNSWSLVKEETTTARFNWDFTTETSEVSVISYLAWAVSWFCNSRVSKTSHVTNHIKIIQNPFIVCIYIYTYRWNKGFSRENLQETIVVKVEPCFAALLSNQSTERIGKAWHFGHQEPAEPAVLPGWGDWTGMIFFAGFRMGILHIPACIHTSIHPYCIQIRA